MKQWDTKTEIVAWLESPAGEAWSRERHKAKHTLITLKADTCWPDEGPWVEWIALWVA